MRIALGSDHRGVNAKKMVKEYLESKDHECVDVGALDEESSDYPDFAIAASEMVSRDEADRGILICGSGVGMSMAANKVKGVRAALCITAQAAKLARQHNDANVLAMGSWQVDEGNVLDIVASFIETGFEGGRHARRVDKITDYEDKHFCDD